MKYRAEIDGLRTVAVIPVILFHAGYSFFSGGFVGVDIFFVISGYLITTILLADLANGRFSIINFYERRARRILPALFLVMLACLPFAWMWLDDQGMKDFSQSLVAVSVFASNILFWIKTNYFEPNSDMWPLLHTWSLAVEEQYYLIIPILMWAIWRFARQLILPVFGILLVISLATAILLVRNNPNAAFYLPQTRAWELLAGGILATLAFKSKINLSPRAHQATSLLGMALIAYSIFGFDENTPFPSEYTIVPVLGTVLVIMSAVPGTLVQRMLSFKPMVMIGLMSYSAYLWHQPIFAFARQRLIREPSAAEYAGLIVLGLILAYISWRYVEAPFRDRNRFGRRSIFLFSLLGIGFFSALGLYGSKRNGLPERMVGLQHVDELKLASPRNGWCFYGVNTNYDASVGENGTKCWVGAKEEKATKRALLFGDSFAGHYDPFWGVIGAREGIRFNSITTNWCYPTFSRKFIGPTGSRAYQQCLYNRDYVSKHLDGYDFVVFSGHWGEVYKQGLLQDALDTIAKVAASGKTIVVMATPKLYNTNPLSAYRKSFLFKLPVPISAVGAELDADASRANTELRDALAAMPNAIFIDRNQMYSPDGKQVDMDGNGVPFSLDGSHISVYGAKAAADIYMKTPEYRKLIERVGASQ